MSSSLAEYLAKNYLTKDPELSDSKKKKKKWDKDTGGGGGGGGQVGGKKKKKKADGGSGIIIADDDAMGWGDDEGRGGSENEDAVVVHSSEFRKSKASNWITTSAGKDDHGAAEANLILSQAAAETRRKTIEDNGGVLSPSPDDDDEPMMESGAAAGLQTASQVAASIARKRAQDLAAMKSTTATPQTTETIYRDASGRIINIAMLRSEARAKAAEEAAKQAAQVEANKGSIQKLEKEEQLKELKEAKFQSLARYKDDIQLNEELKEKELWNDPAAAFLTSKKKGVSRTGKPLYQGAFPPNRYGIRPGHRWDGVDRSNGFEKKWFMARGKKQAKQELEYAWQMDE